MPRARPGVLGVRKAADAPCQPWVARTAGGEGKPDRPSLPTGRAMAWNDADWVLPRGVVEWRDMGRRSGESPSAAPAQPRKIAQNRAKLQWRRDRHQPNDSGAQIAKASAKRKINPKRTRQSKVRLALPSAAQAMPTEPPLRLLPPSPNAAPPASTRHLAIR